MSDTPHEAFPADRPPGSRAAGIRIGALLAVGLAGAFITWLVVGRDDDEAAAPTAATTVVEATQVQPPSSAAALRPTLVSPAELRRLAATSAIPVYWAGVRTGTRIEASRRMDGTFYVRYLPTGMPAGDTGPALTVATYPRAKGFAEVKRAARKGTKTLELPGGGLAVYDASRSTNVHLAYPAEPYQVEVFSPEIGLAQRLVVRGAVRPLR